VPLFWLVCLTFCLAVGVERVDRAPLSPWVVEIVLPVELVDECCQLPSPPRFVTIPQSSTSCPPFGVASETHNVYVLQPDREPLLSSSPCLCTVVG
jgi:hypothetical protein